MYFKFDSDDLNSSEEIWLKPRCTIFTQGCLHEAKWRTTCNEFLRDADLNKTINVAFNFLRAKSKCFTYIQSVIHQILQKTIPNLTVHISLSKTKKQKSFLHTKDFGQIFYIEAYISGQTNQYVIVAYSHLCTVLKISYWYFEWFQRKCT